MRGTAKQIKWAEDIKANMGWEDLKAQMPEGNAAAEKVAHFIDNMEAAIWIETRDYRNADALLRALVTTGWAFKGMTYKADLRTGDVKLSWTEAGQTREETVN